MSIRVNFSDMYATRKDHGKVLRPGWFPRDPCWTTGEGKRIPLADITDNHLVNIFKYLDRRLAGEAPNRQVYVHWLTWIRIIRWEIRTRDLDEPSRTGVVLSR